MACYSGFLAARERAGWGCPAARAICLHRASRESTARRTPLWRLRQRKSFGLRAVGPAPRANWAKTINVSLSDRSGVERLWVRQRRIMRRGLDPSQDPDLLISRRRRSPEI